MDEESDDTNFISCLICLIIAILLLVAFGDVFIKFIDWVLSLFENIIV